MPNVKVDERVRYTLTCPEGIVERPHWIPDFTVRHFPVVGEGQVNVTIDGRDLEFRLKFEGQIDVEPNADRKLVVTGVSISRYDMLAECDEQLNDQVFKEVKTKAYHHILLKLAKDGAGNSIRILLPTLRPDQAVVPETDNFYPRW